MQNYAGPGGMAQSSAVAWSLREVSFIRIVSIDRVSFVLEKQPLCGKACRREKDVCEQGSLLLG